MIAKRFNILFVTQRVSFNDDILGVVNQWLKKLSVKVKKLNILCLEKGTVSLPQNCQVFSLGKESGGNCLKYIFNFYKYVAPLIIKREIDGIFIHMNQVYIFLLVPLWLFMKIYKIPIIWWKSHGYVSWQMKLALKLVTKVATASKLSFPIKTSKKVVIGHGIDTNFFSAKTDNFSEVNNILWVGRISPIKNIETLIEAANILINQNKLDIKFNIIGAPPFSNQLSYFKMIQQKVLDYNLQSKFTFLGSIPFREIPKYYKEADIFVNTSNTNSLDKTVLEAMSSGTIVVNSNISFKEMFNNFPFCQFKQEDSYDLANKIEYIINLSKGERKKIGERLRKIVVTDHNLNNLTDKIINIFELLCQK